MNKTNNHEFILHARLCATNFIYIFALISDSKSREFNRVRNLRVMKVK